MVVFRQFDTFSKPFLNQPHYEEQLTQLATCINDEYPAPVLKSSFTISPFWKAFAYVTGLVGAGYYGTQHLAQYLIHKIKENQK